MKFILLLNLLLIIIHAKSNEPSYLTCLATMVNGKELESRFAAAQGGLYMVQIKIDQLRIDLLTSEAPTLDEELIVFQYNSQIVEGEYLYERYRGTSDYKDSEIFIPRVNNSINKDILRNKQGTIVIMLAAPDLTVGYNCIDTRR